MAKGWASIPGGIAKLILVYSFGIIYGEEKVELKGIAKLKIWYDGEWNKIFTQATDFLARLSAMPSGSTSALPLVSAI